MRNFIGASNFQLDKDAGMKVLRVFGWTVAAAAITLLLNLIKVVEFPPQYIAVIPIVNTVLVALYQFVCDQTA